MRKPIIAGNWKMNKLVAEGARFVVDIREKVPTNEDVDTVVCAPFVHIPFYQKRLETITLKLAHRTCTTKKVALLQVKLVLAC